MFIKILRTPKNQHLFQLLKSQRGNISKNKSKGGWFFGRGFCSDFCTKIGSSAVVEIRQNETFFRTVAQTGGFFFGTIQLKPDVFLGRKGFWTRQEPRFFVFW
ncbi:hypothetical protein KC950_03250 [Candidatus Saccharibacteria bacterium]|nr:hypothetical protein [Candidatus Saccharibacteria bacterium]